MRYGEKDAEFETFVPLETKSVTVSPAGQLEDSFMLFTPTSQVLSLSNTCKTDISFKAQQGLMIQGTITPPLADVEILIENEDIKTKVTSTSQGTFSYGPVPVADYQVTATKDDFILKRQNGFDFRASRIAKLEVSVIDKQEQVL